MPFVQTKELSPHEQRLADIHEKILTYDKAFDLDDIRRALSWRKEPEPMTPVSGKKTPKPLKDEDWFSDPLLILEELLREKKSASKVRGKQPQAKKDAPPPQKNPITRPDRKTILAAILYSKARPVGTNAPDQTLLDNIEAEFGAEVRRTVKRTLRLRAIKFQDLAWDSNQSSKDYHRNARKTALWAAREPGAILIRAAQNNIKLRQIKKTGRFESENKEHLLKIGKEVFAKLLYIAGFDEFCRITENLCFEVRDPVGFRTTTKEIKEAVVAKDPRDPTKEIDLGEIIGRQVSDEIKRKFSRWDEGIHFEVQFREKSAASAKDKAVRKGQLVTQLGDLWAMRIIINRQAIGWPDVPLSDLSEEDRELAAKDLRTKATHVLGRISREFGRLNKELVNERLNPDTKEMEYFSYIQERIKEIEITEPRDKDKGREEEGRLEWEQKTYPDIIDARFDDYYGKPKRNGYRCYQDSIWVYVPGREAPIELECQVLTEIDNDRNTFGPGMGHVYFKADMTKDPGSLEHWYHMVAVETAGRHYVGPKHVYAAAQDDGAILDITHDPTVGGFVEAANSLTGTTISHDDVAVSIFDNYRPTPPGQTFGSESPVPNGCVIKILKTCDS